MIIFYFIILQLIVYLHVLFPINYQLTTTIYYNQGLGFLPGLCCPHHDSTQSNGILRSTDFNAMMRRNTRRNNSTIDTIGEIGIGIDDQTAILVENDKFRVLSTDGKAKVTKKTLKVDGSIIEKVFLPSSVMIPLNELVY